MSSAAGDVTLSASAIGGVGASVDQSNFANSGGSGGSAAASTTGNSGSGNVIVSSLSVGGAGGYGNSGSFGLAGPAGGAADSKSTATSSGAGNIESSGAATGGAGGGASLPGLVGEPAEGGDGGGATVVANASGAGGTVTANAAAKGGVGGSGGADPVLSDGGDGGDATALAKASAGGGGTATATGVATGGGGGAGALPGAMGAANATSSAETAKGALAQAQSTAVGSSGNAQSTALTSYSFVKVQSAAVAQVGNTATTNAIAQGGGSGQTFVNPGQTAYAFSTALDKAYSATLIDGASNVANALLGPRDMVFGTAILGANYASDGGGLSHTYSATSTFDFGYGGDLMLGLIDDQQAGFAGGLGFQSLEFTILANGVEILNSTFESLAVAESFFHDNVIDLGASLGGSGIDLTIGYYLVADGSGGFGFDFAVGGAVPEPSTWAMMLIGFAGLGFAGYRASRKNVAVTV